MIPNGNDIRYDIYRSTDCNHNFWICIEIIDKLKIIDYISNKTKKYLLNEINYNFKKHKIHNSIYNNIVITNMIIQNMMLMNT